MRPMKKVDGRKRWKSLLKWLRHDALVSMKRMTDEEFLGYLRLRGG